MTLSIKRLSVMDSKARRDCVAKDILRQGYHGFGCYRYVVGNQMQNPVFAGVGMYELARHF
jgi:hypothetical protein